MADRERSDTGVLVESFTNSLDDMMSLADTYYMSLPDAIRDNIFNSGSNMFTGAIKYINKHMGFTKEIYKDINTLNDIWDVYVSIVYKYNQKPTIQEYSILIGCNPDTIYSWMNGETRTDDVCLKLGSSRSETIKKWQNECKMGRYKGAQSGNVGCIFLCKAVDGMVETAPIQVENKAQVQSIAEIQQKHGIKQISSTDTTTADKPPDADF